MLTESYRRVCRGPNEGSLSGKAASWACRELGAGIIQLFEGILQSLLKRFESSWLLVLKASTETGCSLTLALVEGDAQFWSPVSWVVL